MGHFDESLKMVVDNVIFEDSKGDAEHIVLILLKIGDPIEVFVGEGGNDKGPL